MCLQYNCSKMIEILKVCQFFLNFVEEDTRSKHELKFKLVFVTKVVDVITSFRNEIYNVKVDLIALKKYLLDLASSEKKKNG